MSSQIKVLVYISGLPLPASYDVAVIQEQVAKRLVYDLLPAEALAISYGLTIAQQVDVLTVGNKAPKEICRKALALGATEAIHVGAVDWPNQPSYKMLAAAIADVATDYDLLLLADNGSHLSGGELAIYCGLALERLAFTGVFELSQGEQGIAIKRRLEQGRRQMLTLPLPGVIAIKSDSQYLVSPKAMDLLAAETKAIREIPLEYSLLQRRLTKGAHSPDIWQPAERRPNSQEVWHPDNNLSGSQRLASMITGNTKSRATKEIKGAPEACAKEIVGYLVEQGILARK